MTPQNVPTQESGLLHNISTTLKKYAGRIRKNKIGIQPVVETKIIEFDEIAKILNKPKIVDVLKQNYPNRNLFLRNDANDISKKTGIELNTIETIQESLCLSVNEHFSVPLATAFVLGLSNKDNSAKQIAKLTPQDCLEIINGSGVPVKEEEKDIVHLSNVIASAKKRFPYFEYYDNVISNLHLSPNLMNLLRQDDSLQQLRKRLIDLKKQGVLQEEQITQILAHTKLEIISKNFKLNQQLINNQIQSAYQVAKIPLSEFKNKYSNFAEPSELDQVHSVASGITAKAIPLAVMVRLSKTKHHFDKVIGNRNDQAKGKKIQQSFLSKTNLLSESDCECVHCASVLSPAAYLLALMGFVREYLKVDPKSLFTKRMHRSELLKLNIDCDLVETPLPQIEIVIKALLDYTQNNPNTQNVYSSMSSSLNPPPFFYEGVRFREYLNALGISLIEIHETFSDPTSQQSDQLLSEKLGISYPEFQRLTTKLGLDETEDVLDIERGALAISLAKTNADLKGKELSQFLGLNKKDLEGLIQIHLIKQYAQQDIIDINFEGFDLLRRITVLMRVLGFTPVDMTALLNATKVTDLTSKEIKKLHEIWQTGNVLALSGVELEKLIKDPKNNDNELHQLSRSLGIDFLVLDNLLQAMSLKRVDINSLDRIADICRMVTSAQAIGLTVDSFTLLKRPLDQNQLVEYLGLSPDELSKLISAKDKDKLAEALGISTKDLVDIIFKDFHILFDSKPLNDVSKISSFKELELVHQPLRVAQALNVNLEEYRLILYELKILPGKDANEITLDQILQAGEMLSLVRVAGTNLTDLQYLIKDLDQLALVKLLGFIDVNDMNNTLNFPVDQLWACLGEKLGIAPSDIKDLANLIKVNSPLKWEELRDIYRYTGLSRQAGITSIDLHALLKRLNANLSDVDNYWRAIALSIAPKDLVKLLSVTCDSFQKIINNKHVLWLYRINSLANSLGISLEELASLNRWEHQITEKDVKKLCSLLERQYDEKQLAKELSKPNERIWSQTRDALCKYAISKYIIQNNGNLPVTVKGLSDYLLIDLEISPTLVTTEIQQAIESIQKFVQRATSGQEQIAVIDDDTRKVMEEEWRWMQRYVLFEAAMKVFLYPENFIMPQLRDDKTPFFKDLEDELSQGEVTQALAEKAISGYIEKLHTISSLRVSGVIYEEPPINSLHVFARSRTGDQETFHRVFKDLRYWGPWIKLDAEINANHVYPLVAYGRIYIFWIETEEEEKDYQKEYKHKFMYCFTTGENKWSKPCKHDLVLPQVQEPYIELSEENGSIVATFGEEKIENVNNGDPNKIHSLTYSIACNDSFINLPTRNLKTRKFFISEPNKISAATSFLSTNSKCTADVTEDGAFGSKRTGIGIFSEKNGLNILLTTESISYHSSDPLKPFKDLIFISAEPTSNIVSGMRCCALSNLYSPFLYNQKSVLSLDNAIEIGSNLFFFCSDQYRCLMIVAHISQDGCNTKQVRFAICQLNYGKYCELTDELFQEGLDNFYDPEFQVKDLELNFDSAYGGYNMLLDVVQFPPKKLEFQGPNGIYNWEIFFHIPYLIADGLMQNRKFELAQQWYRYIFDPVKKIDNERWKFLPFKNGVVDPLSSYINDPEDAYIWRSDPFSPHALARVRPGAYQKAVVLSYVDNLMEWADQEFARDTRESINYAHGLYSHAEELLLLKEIDQETACDRLILDIRVALVAAVGREKARNLGEKLKTLTFLPSGKIDELHREILSIADSDTSQQVKAEAISKILDNKIKELRLLNLQRGDTLSSAGNKMKRDTDAVMEESVDAVASNASDGSRVCIPQNWLDPIASITPELEQAAIRFLATCMEGCIPENPIFQVHRNHIESNLRKIRAGRNIAGIQRILSIYEASIDPMSAVKTVASGAGLEALNFSNAAGIGPYRFAYLIERAKMLANQVVQAGNALLLAIEKKESEELAYMRAQQDLKLAKANVHLRKLGVTEAEDGLSLATLQTIRAEFQSNHYQVLIESKNKFEEDALLFLIQSIDLLKDSQSLQDKAAEASLVPTVSTGATTSVSYGGSNLAGNYGGKAGASSTEASIWSTQSAIASMNASFERRKEEWEFQRDLAEKDKAISAQNEQIAKDRIAIAEMEQQIAELQAENADQIFEFLKNKFTNKQLYTWMVKTLSKVLYGFYNLAYANARMAQATLEFERNETLDFISYGYWDSEKKGLLSGDQLLLDITKLDDYYIHNNARKHEKTKHIFLSQMAPEALLALKSSGVTTFATPMVWFDRDRPGHYQRIIKCVKVSILALIGPGASINATLSTISPSRVILDPENPVPVDVPRIQSVELSGASNATGLFETNYRDERYLPFEGSGVDVTWQLEMPKPSNSFDFNSLIDIMLTIDYTSLSDSEYKKAVIKQLGNTTGGVSTVSARSNFPDTWYEFNNPIWLERPQGGGDAYAIENIPKPYSLKLDVHRPMFPPNEESHTIDHVALYFSLADSNIRIPLKINYKTENGRNFQLNNARTGDGGFLSIESGVKGLSPFGTWNIEIDRDNAPEQLWAKKKDETWAMETTTTDNARHVLDGSKISDVMLAITYKAKVEWPPES